MMKKVVTSLVSVVALIASQSVFWPVKGKNLMSSFSQCVQFKRKVCVLLNVISDRSLKFIRLLRVVFSSQQLRE